MKLLYTAILLTLMSLTCHAQVTTNGFQTSTFANLSSQPSGKVRYCPDCAATNPCSGGGSGAFAYRIGSAWVCNNASSSGSSGAPLNATYITQTANASLTNEQVLSVLSNGLMRVAASTGVITSINTSAGVKANITDETGSGALVFGDSPTITSATNVTPSVTTSVTLNGAVSVSSGSAGDFTILPTGNIILNPSGNQVNPTTNYDINLGSNAKKFLSLSAAELLVETLVAQQTIGTIGGRILVGPTTPLIADLTNVATTFDVKYNNLASGDRVYMETPGQVEFMAVTSAATPISGGYRYSITRNLDGTGANDWTAGDAVFNTGTTGDGFIDQYSDSGIASGVGPTIVGNVRNSATYNDWSPTWAIGNLDGLYGYSGATYGAAFGKYAASNSIITVDSTNGIRILNGTSTVIGQWSTAGVITIGEVGASKDNIQISSGAISIRNNTTERIGMTAAGILTIKDSGGNAVLTFDASNGAEITKKLTMSGAASAIAIGSTPPTSSTSGTGIWIDRNSLVAVNAGTQTAAVSNTGIQVIGNGAFQAKNAAGTPTNLYTSTAGGGFINGQLTTNTQGTGDEARLNLQAAGTDLSITNLSVLSGALGTGHQFRFYNDTNPIDGVTIGANSAPVQMLDVRGRTLTIGAQWVTGSKPTCDSGNRGTVWYVAGGAGVADTFELCRKDNADAYAWVSLF